MISRKNNVMNKVVLVTGSSRGIGKATVIEFASKGYNVVINYNSSDKEANDLKDYVEKNFNVKALSIKADVSNEEEVKNMITNTLNEFGRVDVLVNNAGIVYDRDFKDIKVEEFKRTLEVNVIGAFIVAREVSKYMKKGSSIVNVSSTNGTGTSTTVSQQPAKTSIPTCWVIFSSSISTTVPRWELTTPRRISPNT